MTDRHPSLDYNYIADGIYIGTNACCQAHFDERLLQEGIEADISLEEDRVDAPFGVQTYLWLPVKDHTAPTQNQLETGTAVLEKLSRQNKKVYVHCKNGHGRAPTLVAAYFISRGKTTTEALALLKKQRPSVHLHPSQIEALKTFAVNH